MRCLLPKSITAAERAAVILRLSVLASVGSIRGDALPYSSVVRIALRGGPVRCYAFPICANVRIARFGRFALRTIFCERHASGREHDYRHYRCDQLITHISLRCCMCEQMKRFAPLLILNYIFVSDRQLYASVSPSNIGIIAALCWMRPGKHLKESNTILSAANSSKKNSSFQDNPAWRCSFVALNHSGSTWIETNRYGTPASIQN